MNNETSRRGFLSWLTGIGTFAFLGSILYPIFKFLIPPKSVEANVSQVKLPFTRANLESEAKKSKTFKFGRILGLIVLAADGTLHAVSATCTHLDCTVQYRPDLGVIWCACHNGKYDLNGKNISGPPPKPLEKFAVNEVGDDIFVSKETA